MIEETLKKQSAKSIANTFEVYDSLEGETIVTILDGITNIGSDGWIDVFIFESGCSFVRHSRGGYWINNKEKTRDLLTSQLEHLQGEHKKYEVISNLLKEEII